MNESTIPSDETTRAPFSLAKTLTCLALSIVIGATGFLLVHYGIKSGNKDETDVVLPSGNKEPNALSEDSSWVPTESLATQLTDPDLQHNTVQRFSTVYSYVATVSEQNLSDTLLRATEDNWIQSVRVRVALQTALLERLVMTTPQTALEFALAQKSPLQSKLVKTVFDEWASIDLKACLEQVKSLGEPLRIVALTGIIEARGELPLSRIREIGGELNLESQAVSLYIASLNTEHIKDPKSKWYELVSVPDASDTSGYELASRIAHMWYQKEGISVLEEILNSEAEDRFQRDSINRILESITREDPTQAFQYAQNIPQEGVFQMFPPTIRIVSIWAQTDPLAALEAAKIVETNGLRERLQASAVNSWASTNPQELLANLETLPKSTQMSAVSRAFSHLAQSSPIEGSSLVLQLEDPVMRARAAEAFIYRWAQEDVDSSLDWVLEYPDTEPVRERLMATVLSMMVDSDPKRAVQIAKEQPIAEGRELGLEAQLVSALAFRDVDTAIELLPEVRDGETKSAVYRAVGVSLVANGEPQKALSLVQQLPDTAKAGFFRSISYEWAKFDPPAVLTALEEFPTAEIRSEVARELSRLHTQNFSDSEMETLKQYIIEDETGAIE